MSRPRPPGFVRHLLILWELRFTLAFQSRPRGARLAGVGFFLVSCLPALPLGIAAWTLLSHPTISASPVYSQLALGLVSFVAAAIWFIWPIVSAGVDDASEATRYSAFPITTARLLVASTVAGLCEPIAIIVFSPVAAAAAAYARIHPPASILLGIALFAGYLALAAAWSRAGLHLALNVLRHHRSAEAIGGGFLALALFALLVPPARFPWGQVLSGGLGGLDDRFVRHAARGLTRMPTGWMTGGLSRLARGDLAGPAVRVVALAAFAAAGFWIAHRLLVRFHREAGRRGASRPEPRDGRDPLRRARTRFGTLVAREALDLWRNPRARLLSTVPFLLMILFRLISGRALASEYLGDAADAWLLGALSIYGVVVLASAFTQNSFGYDGHGLATVLAAPVPLSAVLAAKNAVHAATGFVLAAASALFYVVYLRAGNVLDLAAALGGVFALTPVLLAAGNFLSFAYPTRFDATLRRRASQPRAAMAIGVAAASLGSVPFVLTLRAAGGALGAAEIGRLLAIGLAAWAIYAATWPMAVRVLVRRREAILQAVTRG